MDLETLITKAEDYLSTRAPPRKKYKTFKLRKFEGIYNPDLERLSRCLKPLKKLNNMVGMEDLKKNIANQILFYCQRLNSNEMMHTCLTGPPGVGKTTVGKILAELYCSLGCLETDNFNVVTSADLVAGYVGQTAIKTRKLLTNSLGGVLFLDEAYSINSGSDDIGYAKECADTINAFLTEHTSNFIMIISGYQNELDRCFFSLNQGLRRRFPWVYNIDKYTPENLSEILFYQISESDWDFEDSFNFIEFSDIISENKDLFGNNGGDTQILFDKIKIQHSNRVFGLKRKYKMKISIDDIRSGIQELKKHKSKIKKDEVPYGMYV
jgi:replication-associated recombination protein RarA